MASCVVTTLIVADVAPFPMYVKAELSGNPADSNRDQARIADEVGDILFVAVNLARKAGIDPETALMGCNSKFEQRFRYIEQESEKYCLYYDTGEKLFFYDLHNP